jgi:hypothetical protein
MGNPVARMDRNKVYEYTGVSSETLEERTARKT